VLAGLVGTRDHMEYAGIGQTVNVAARVQTLTRTEERGIVLTAAVREKLDPTLPLEPRPRATVKGIAEPIETFAVP
jgi:class 3 adenylate cyclase